MADLAYTSAIQTLIAQSVFGKAYSSLITTEKELIDGTWSSGTVNGGEVKYALQRIQQRAQAFYLAGAAAAPDVWENVLVAEAAAAVSKHARPDKVRGYVIERERIWGMALDSFTVDATSLSTLAGQDITIQGMWFYVLSTGARLSPRRFFDVGRIDAETQWVLNYAWNRTGWNMRKRQCRLRIRYIAITGGTWTQSSLTLTKTSGFTDYVHTAGARFQLVSGTGAVVGDYIVGSKTSNNAIVLTTTINTAADGQTDIAGYLTWVEFVGLGASESFDSVASREWYYDDTGEAGSRLVWAGDADDMARMKAVGTNRGRPAFFRTENRAGTIVWYFADEPDAAYNARGEVFIAGPGTPGTATETTVFNKFPAEMRPHLRDLVLGRVYTRHGIAAGEGIFQRAVEDVNALFPGFEDAGSVDDTPWPRDVYGDMDMLPDGTIGGAI